MVLSVGDEAGVEHLGERARPGDRLEPLDPFLVGHALGLEAGDLGRLRRVLLGEEHLPGIVEHRLDDAHDVDDVRRVVTIERGDDLDGERHQRRREPQRAALVLALDE